MVATVERSLAFLAALLVGVGASACGSERVRTGGATTRPWTQLAGDASRANWGVSEPVPPMQLAWSFIPEGAPLPITLALGEPVTDGNVVFVSSDRLSALNLDGRVVWEFGRVNVASRPAENELISAPLLVDDLVVVAVVKEDVTVTALRASNGETVWRHVRPRPAGVKDVWLAESGGRVLLVLDPEARAATDNVQLLSASGDVIWTGGTRAVVISGPAMAEGLVVVETLEGLMALDASSGDRVWLAEDTRRNRDRGLGVGKGAPVVPAITLEGVISLSSLSPTDPGVTIHRLALGNGRLLSATRTGRSAPYLLGNLKVMNGSAYVEGAEFKTSSRPAGLMRFDVTTLELEGSAISDDIASGAYLPTPGGMLLAAYESQPNGPASLPFLFSLREGPWVTEQWRAPLPEIVEDFDWPHVPREIVPAGNFAFVVTSADELHAFTAGPVPTTP